ncbi:MAG: 50S ribosomal protein L2 [Nanoarchaeota archaeon]
MGKRIITQRRGRGTSRYRAPSHNFHYNVNYPKTNEKLNGKVIEIIKDPARTAPTAVIQFNDKTEIALPAPLNVREGDDVNYNSAGELKPLTILSLSEIPEGTQIFNIESNPGDGGKFCRAAGTSGKVISKFKDYILVRLPSKKEKKFNPLCRATIGVISALGRLEKPMLKAGKHHHAMKARNKLYPKTSGVAMNAVDHPFGSGRGRHVGKPKTAPRNAPPGRNVGLIGARRTGRRK